MILVDTSSLVHLLRRKGNPAIKERVRAILRSGDAAICPMIEVELWMGSSSDKDARDVQELSELLISLPATEAVWKEAARLARGCRELGKPVPSSDVVIAATAFVHGATIDTEDRHFEILGALPRGS